MLASCNAKPADRDLIEADLPVVHRKTSVQIPQEIKKK